MSLGSSRPGRDATMANHQLEGGIYIYRGGRAPQHITHAIIDKSIKKVDDNAFKDNRDLHTVETHDGLEEIGISAFSCCESLTHLDIRSVRILQSYSFCSTGLTEVDADNLEIIEDNVFTSCESLRRIFCPKVTKIGGCAFEHTLLTEIVLPNVEFIDGNAFVGNFSLRRIYIPLKPDLFDEDLDEGSFDECGRLGSVVLIGGIHDTVSSFHMEDWSEHMAKEINRINKTLFSNQSSQKTNVIRWWLQSVYRRFEHYKAEHTKILKEASVLLELALWTAKLDDDECVGYDGSLEAPAKKVKIDAAGRTRNEQRITSGADIVIKNVLPFLALNSL